MARPVILDFLQSYSFWLADFTTLEYLSMPVLNPLFGFSSISAPTVQAEIETIKEGNWFLDRKVVKSGSVSPITATRGVIPWDSDFYAWMMAGLSGNTTGWQASAAGLNLLQSLGGATPRRDLVLIHFFPRSPIPGIGGPFEFTPKIPALAYLLQGCIPSSYVPSSEFDANSSAISITSLTIEVESVTRISLATI